MTRCRRRGAEQLAGLAWLTRAAAMRIRRHCATHHNQHNNNAKRSAEQKPTKHLVPSRQLASQVVVYEPVEVVSAATVEREP